MMVDDARAMPHSTRDRLLTAIGRCTRGERLHRQGCGRNRGSQRDRIGDGRALLAEGMKVFWRTSRKKAERTLGASGGNGRPRSVPRLHSAPVNVTNDAQPRVTRQRRCWTRRGGCPTTSACGERTAASGPERPVGALRADRLLWPGHIHRGSLLADPAGLTTKRLRRGDRR